MNKTFTQRANDCGIGPQMLERVLCYEDHNTTPELLCSQVRALYGRIEQLENAMCKCVTDIPDVDAATHRDRIAEINGVLRQSLYP